MDVDDDVPLWESPLVFVAAACLIEMLLFTMLAYSVARHWRDVRGSLGSAAAYVQHLARSVSFCSRAGSTDQLLVTHEVRNLRRDIGRRVIWTSVFMMVLIVGWIQVRAILQMRAPTRFFFAWTCLAHLLWMILAVLLPRLARTDWWYFMNSMITMLYLLPANATVDRDTNYALMFFFFFIFRLPAILLASRIYLVMGCNFVFLVTVTVRELRRDYVGGELVVATECLFFICIVALAIVLKDYLTRRAERDLEGIDTMSQLNAASSLLQLTCDAVIELDSSLCLTKHSRELSAMLLRDSGERPGSSLQGVKFTDLMPASDVAFAVTQLTEFRSSCRTSASLGGTPSPNHRAETSAHAFHTRLIDSCATKLQTEVLQVMYTKQGNKTCHLVGLRDFTDTQPYLSPEASMRVGSLHQELDMPDSAALSCCNSPSDDFDQPSPCTAWQHLELDLENQVVTAVSPPYEALAGSQLSTVFPAPHTAHLLERMHAEGRLSLERGQRLPRRIFSYQDLPVCLGEAGRFQICGTMQMVRTQSGVNVLMAFQTSLSTNASPSPTSPSSRRSSRSSRSSRRTSSRYGSPPRSLSTNLPARDSRACLSL